MDFRLLGPLEASERGRAVRLGGPRQRAVLAHLLIRANQVVSSDRLIEEVWSGEPPEAARNALQSYVSRLRRRLGDGARIEGRAPGYVLHVDPERIDAVRFEALLGESRRRLADDPEDALERLQEALSLWRGPPLADLQDELSLRAEIGRLEELRLGAVEDRIETELALGRQGDLAPELESLVEEHPLRERLWGQLMLALYRSERQADALAAYRRARRLLADELGLEPSPELRELERRILRHDPLLEPEARRLRGYRLLEQIGAGSFGVVYRATQPHVGREVAAKVINPALANDPRFVRRFEAEAQVVARLEHPHVVPLYDYWRDPGGAYLVMRLLRGGSLKQALERRSLAPERAVALVTQVASGLATAHRVGIVHRDVKPANILLDEEGNAYLSDFGIATDVAAEVTLPTPESLEYVSPEQARGEPCTPGTDVYSLGVVLRQALAGAALPPMIADVIAQATAAEPRDRYPDADALRAALRSAAPTRPTAAVVPTRNPYKGLRPFAEPDAIDFFGRESLVERLVGRLCDGARFLALVGASGSGKSSAVRAGLVPALRQGAVPGSADWLVVQMSPGDEPLEALEAALLTVATDTAPRLSEPRRCELVLFVDQFEELYTLTGDDEKRERFLDELAAAADARESRVRIVVTLRADFYDRPLEHPAFARLLRSGVETIVPLSAHEVGHAVTGPATRVGARCEPGLLADLVAGVSLEPGALPLLQYALTELFERREDGTLTHEAYRRLGGLAGAVARRAEELYEQAGDAGREAMRQLFLRLVAIGAGSEEARRRVSRLELAALEVDQAELENVIEALGRHRLVSFDRDPDTRMPTVEVAHEALIGAWGRLRGWIDDAREDVRMRARLGEAAQEWDASRRDSGFLLAGTRLGLFDAWAAASSVALARTEREFLEASRERRDAERAEEEARRAREAALERRSRQRLRALAVVLAAAALTALGLSLFAFSQREDARTQAARAEREARAASGRELAAAALANLDADPERSVLLALQAVETTAVDGSVLREAEEALHSAVQRSRVVLSVPASAGALSFSADGKRLATIGEDGTAVLWAAASGRKLLDLAGPVTSVAFGPDARVATGGPGLARLWSSASGSALRTLSSSPGPVTALAFSRDGTRLATTGTAGEAAVWNLRTGDRLAILRQVGEAPALALSPDGTRLAIADGTAATVWDVRSRRVLRRLPLPAFGVAFSPDGSRLAVVGLNGLIGVWSTSDGSRLLSVSGHDGHVRSVEFSRDDRRLATAGDDGTVRVWEARTGRELLVLPGQGAVVEQVAFSPDGTRVAGCCGGGRAMVWDLTPEGSRELLTVAGHDGMVFSVAFSRDGRRLATASADGTAKVWDAARGSELLELSQHRGPVSDIAFSPDGRRLATASFDLTARLWDAGTGAPGSILRGHTAPLWGVSFAPDGRRVATVSEDTTGKIWDTETARRLSELRGHTSDAFDVVYSPDGARIATVGDDRTARIWDARTGAELRALRGHVTNIVQVAFSPDGGTLATAGLDTARVWDVATGRQRFALTGHAASVLDVDYSPDGTRVATASLDGTARLWDAQTGREMLSLGVPGGEAGRLAFSPDGARLAVAGVDAVRVYALRLDDLVTLARSRLTRGLTPDECRQYLHRDRCPG